MSKLKAYANAIDYYCGRPWILFGGFLLYSALGIWFRSFMIGALIMLGFLVFYYTIGWWVRRERIAMLVDRLILFDIVRNSGASEITFYEFEDYLDDFDRHLEGSNDEDRDP